MKKIILLILFAGILLSSFKSNEEKLLSKTIRDSYQYIPSGYTIKEGKKIHVQAFYMMSTEVSNLNYKEFLAFLERNQLSQKQEIAKTREDGWNDEVFQKTYFRHPAYDDYPVVNITKKAAQLYCDWLEETLNHSGHIKEGYQVVDCRLPTSQEWIVAAQSGHPSAIYPWGGFYTRNAKGCVLANYNQIGEEQITFDTSSGQYRVIENAERPAHAIAPAPVKSFWPNDFGLYNMSGNIAEMVFDKDVVLGGSWHSTGYDIRIQSEMPFNNYSPQVGFRPVFQIVKK